MGGTADRRRGRGRPRRCTERAAYRDRSRAPRTRLCRTPAGAAGRSYSSSLLWVYGHRLQGHAGIEQDQQPNPGVPSKSGAEAGHGGEAVKHRLDHELPEFTEREQALLTAWDERNAPPADGAFHDQLLAAYRRAEEASLRSREAADADICLQMACDAALVDARTDFGGQ